MKLDSVRDVKQQARDVVSRVLRNDVSRRRLGVRAQSIENALQPRSIALGVAGTNGDYKLAVRVQHPLLVEGKEVEAIRQMAKGEVDVRCIGQVQKRPAPGTSRTVGRFASDVRWHTSRLRQEQ